MWHSLIIEIRLVKHQMKYLVLEIKVFYILFFEYRYQTTADFWPRQGLHVVIGVVACLKKCPSVWPTRLLPHASQDRIRKDAD